MSPLVVIQVNSLSYNCDYSAVVALLTPVFLRGLRSVDVFLRCDILLHSNPCEQ